MVCKTICFFYIGFKFVFFTTVVITSGFLLYMFVFFFFAFLQTDGKKYFWKNKI